MLRRTLKVAQSLKSQLAPSLICRMLSRAQVIRRVLVLPAQHFSQYKTKPTRHRTTGWFGLSQSTQVYPDSLEDLLGELSLTRVISFCGVHWGLCPAAAALSIHCFVKAAPVPGAGHLPGDKEVSPQVGQAWWGSWPGRTGLWGAGVQSCCFWGRCWWFWGAELGAAERQCRHRNTCKYLSKQSFACLSQS